jgi:hypothetical protein
VQHVVLQIICVALCSMRLLQAQHEGVSNASQRGPCM